jgi:hypothetical protein
VVALPLAVVGIGGVLAMVLLHGEQPQKQAARPTEATSRPTLVSVRTTDTVTVPPSSSDSGAAGVEEAGGRQDVQRVPMVVIKESPVQPSTVERHERRDASWRHWPTQTTTPVVITTPVPITTSAPTGTPPTSQTEVSAPVPSSSTVAPEPSTEVPVSTTEPKPEPSPAPVPTTESSSVPAG